MAVAVIDAEVVDELVEFAGIEALADLHGLFVTQFAEGLPAMRAELDGGDREALSQRAHTLKGTAGYLGLTALSEALAALESATDEAALQGVFDRHDEATSALDAHDLFGPLRA